MSQEWLKGLSLNIESRVPTGHEGQALRNRSFMGINSLIYRSLLATRTSA